MLIYELLKARYSSSGWKVPNLNSSRSGPALSSGGPPKTCAPSIWVETSARPSRVLTNLTQ